MALERSEKKMVLQAINSALPFFTRKIPVESMMLPCLNLSSDTHTLNVLNRINKQSHDAFNPILKSKRLQQLLNHVTQNNQDEAEKIIASNPELLLMRGTTQSYAGDTIEDVTPMELAYGEENSGMFKMMLPYMRLPQEVQTDLFKQLNERYPEAKEEKYDFDPIVAAITSDDKKTIDVALKKFRNDFAPRVIKREDGKYLNRITEAFANSLLVFSRHYKVDHSEAGWFFHTWSYHQFSLFGREIIDYLKRRLPACHAKKMCSYAEIQRYTRGGCVPNMGDYYHSFRRSCQTTSAAFRDLMQHPDSKGRCVIL